MANDAGGGSGPLTKTQRETWAYKYKSTNVTYNVANVDANNYSKNGPVINYESKDIEDEIRAASANEEDVDTIKFKDYMDTIDREADALLDSKEFDVGNISIMIDNKNIVETCITDLKADIENDVKKLKAELDAAYNEVVAYHNVKQVDYNSAAENKARRDCNSGTPKHEEIPE